MLALFAEREQTVRELEAGIARQRAADPEGARRIDAMNALRRERKAARYPGLNLRRMG